MKSVKYVSPGVMLVFLVALTFPGGTISADTEPFSLHIEAIVHRLLPGSPVEVKLTLTNSSEHEITFVDTSRWCDYTIEVRNSRGQFAPETSFARQMKCPQREVGRRITRDLQPGQSFEDVFYVNHFYDLSNPDDYFIQVARQIPKELGKGSVKSNVVTAIVGE